MLPVRFLHAADLHLDSPFKGMAALPEPIRERVREATFESLRALVALAERERVDFVVVSGDVYDLADRSLRAQIRFQRALERLAAAEIPVFVIHGNHDPEDGRAAQLNWPQAVHFFAADRVETVAVEKPGRGVIAHVHGISYKTAAVHDNLALGYRGIDPNVCQIALLHTNVDGDPAHGNYAPCSRRDLLERGIDYWALGHVHTRQVLHDRPAIVYPGNIQGRSVRETGPRGCYVVDIDETGRAALAFHALDAVRWHHETVSVQGVSTEQQLKDVLLARLEQVRESADGRAAVVRLVLEGRSAVGRLLRKGRALEELTAELRDGEADRSRFVWLESIDDRSRGELDWEALQQEESFLGDLLRLSVDLQRDEEALHAFAAEALAALDSLPAAAGRPLAAGAEQLREWLRAAEELAADLLAGEGGKDA